MLDTRSAPAWSFEEIARDRLPLYPKVRWWQLASSGPHKFLLFFLLFDFQLTPQDSPHNNWGGAPSRDAGVGDPAHPAPRL
jgi:hypothetical protein